MLTGFNRELIYNRQSWICRAVNEGLLQPNYQEHPFSTWVAALVVAMLQLLGGVAEIQPNNDAESVVFIFSVLVGTVVFAGVQGVIIRVITTGGPDEMFFRQGPTPSTRCAIGASPMSACECATTSDAPRAWSSARCVEPST